jgi:hypothetical protein
MFIILTSTSLDHTPQKKNEQGLTVPRLATRQGLQLPANHQTRRSGDIGFGDSFRWMKKMVSPSRMLI